MDTSVGSLYLADSDWPGCQALEQLVRELVPDRSWFKLALDLGCGAGSRTKALLELFRSLQKIVAIDADASMIAVAKTENADGRINYLLHSIQNLAPLNLSGIDCVSAVYVLHWLKEKEKLFADLRKITSPGALFLIATGDGMPTIYEQIDQLVREHLQIDTLSPFWFLTRSQWLKLLPEWGWKVLATKSNLDESIVDNGRHCLTQWHSASAGRAFYERDLNDFPNEFIDSLIAKLDPQYRQENGKWRFTEEDLLIVCQRS